MAPKRVSDMTLVMTWGDLYDNPQREIWLWLAVSKCFRTCPLYNNFYHGSNRHRHFVTKTIWHTVKWPLVLSKSCFVDILSHTIKQGQY